MKNYTVKNLGKWSGVQGKLFLAEELQLTGAQVSVQKLAPGEDAPFLHAHKTHEEVYIIVSGHGDYQVDGEVIPVSEGSVVRVSPAGMRALRNSGTEDMVMLCLQYEQRPITTFMEDAIVSDASVRW